MQLRVGDGPEFHLLVHRNSACSNHLGAASSWRRPPHSVVHSRPNVLLPDPPAPENLRGEQTPARAHQQLPRLITSWFSVVPLIVAMLSLTPASSRSATRKSSGRQPPVITTDAVSSVRRGPRDGRDGLASARGNARWWGHLHRPSRGLADHRPPRHRDLSQAQPRQPINDG